MSKCSRCQQRKAKRYCIALDESLCNLCCGRLREKEVHCPPKCSFLSKHKPYHEKRIIEKKRGAPHRKIPEEDILNDERMAWLVYSIEMQLREYTEKTASFTDKDALIALEYAREKVEKNRGIIILPANKIKPQNEAGEAIYGIVEKCLYERRIVLSGVSEGYNRKEKIQCLDRVILSVKYFAEEDFGSRQYLHNLQERFAKIRAYSHQKKIITLT